MVQEARHASKKKISQGLVHKPDETVCVWSVQTMRKLSIKRALLWVACISQSHSLKGNPQTLAALLCAANGHNGWPAAVCSRLLEKPMHHAHAHSLLRQLRAQANFGLNLLGGLRNEKGELVGGNDVPLLDGKTKTDRHPSTVGIVGLNAPLPGWVCAEEPEG